MLMHQILSYSSTAASAPIDQWRPSLGNETALRHNTAPSWVQEPRYRGTWGILYSCTITLLLCVYNAMHLNVPAYDEGRFANFWRGIKWALIAIVAPEVTLLAAFFQFYQAWRLCMQLEELKGNSIGNPDSIGQSANAISLAYPPASERVQAIIFHWFSRTPVPRKRFPLAYGFYAGMGGFTVDTKDLPEFDRYPKNTRLAITPSGLVVLAKKGHFLEVDIKTIKNKSKADILAKGLAILQVTWMAIEVIARKLKGFPLSVLEIHTLVHVFCALLMYSFWFEKPAGVQDPTLVDESTGNILREAIDSQQVIDLSVQTTSQATKKYAKIHEILPLVTVRVLNACDIVYFFSILGSIIMSIGVFIVFAAYAGVHMSAWNYKFPTTVDGLIWKVSCICIMAGSVAAIPWLGMVEIYVGKAEYSLRQVMPLYWQRLEDSFGRGSVSYTLGCGWNIFSVIMIPLFLCARMAIVVESFISVWKVPEGVYATVVWTQYIPHF
ncbi:hypothetical protein BDD12DRAFT_882216 [Trichophaea hybrida]|nr:hypothetical protein BDD12DRAFT_882216 [Trichophaea hybrida]